MTLDPTHKCVQRPVHQASAAIQTDMKLPPSPDRPVFLQTFFYSSFRRTCCVLLWWSTAGGPVCQWGGGNNGGACVAGSVHPLAPNTAESSPRLFTPPSPPPLITSPSVSPCLQFRHVSVFLLSCLSVSFCLQPTKTAIQPRRWWAGGEMPRLHRSSAAGTALLSVAD